MLEDFEVLSNYSEKRKVRGISLLMIQLQSNTCGAKKLTKLCLRQFRK
jgi:hypothetical protein